MAVRTPPRRGALSAQQHMSFAPSAARQLRASNCIHRERRKGRSASERKPRDSRSARCPPYVAMPAYHGRGADASWRRDGLPDRRDKARVRRHAAIPRSSSSAVRRQQTTYAMMLSAAAYAFSRRLSSRRVQEGSSHGSRAGSRCVESQPQVRYRQPPPSCPEQRLKR
jgi:hypothetical protein